MKFFKSILIMTLLLSLTGCASFNKKLKTWLNGDDSNRKVAQAPVSQDKLVTFSENPNTPIPQDHEYHRMTKKRFEEEELFSDNAGSLWVMEGQDSYLFTQNIVRLPGDILNVDLDGQPEKQLSTKAQVIKDLTDRIERAKRSIATTPANGQPNANSNAASAAGQDQNKQAAAAPAAPKPEDKVEDGNYNFDVKTVPARVVERMSDGSYRVKGAQTFMIGPKEYKVIVTGLVKPSDISNDSIAASKMMDSRFDIVRYAKGKTL